MLKINIIAMKKYYNQKKCYFLHLFFFASKHLIPRKSFSLKERMEFIRCKDSLVASIVASLLIKHAEQFSGKRNSARVNERFYVDKTKTAQTTNSADSGEMG